jgi:hypothetical protein
LRFGDAPTGQAADTRPAIDFRGPAQSSYQSGVTDSAALVGGYSGQASEAELLNWKTTALNPSSVLLARYGNQLYANGTAVSAQTVLQWAADSGVPPVFAQLSLDPSHIHFSAQVSGGIFNTLTRTLTIDPIDAVPAPEPTPLAVLILCAVSLRFMRRESGRRSRVRGSATDVPSATRANTWVPG